MASKRAQAKVQEALVNEAHFASTHADMARQMLIAHGERLLITHNDQMGGSELWETDSTGIWQQAHDVLHSWMVERGDELRMDAAKAAAGNKNTARALFAQLRPWFTVSSVKHVRESAHGSYLALLKKSRAILNESEDFGVTLRLETKLDADLRYLGCEDGVIDLHTGKLLSPEEGRKHLVTKRTPVAWDPDATHPDVGRLFAHLPAEERRWWWRVLGHHLRGHPNSRIYEVIGPPNGGKSGLIAALVETLGPYASSPQATLLASGRRGAPESETGLSPGVVHVVGPYRLAFFDEVKPTRLNHKQLKEWAGDGAPVTWQPKHNPPRTDVVTATMFLFCNDGQEARLNLQDAGMRRRLQTLRYPEIPVANRIDEWNEVRVKDPEFKKALLARLVREASQCTEGKPPEPPASIKKSTSERIAADIGELGLFAKRLVRGGTVSLTVPEVWAAWCEYNDEPPDSREAGGISRTRLSTRLREHVDSLPAPTMVKVANKNARGWRGWKLLSPEEAEQAAAEQQATLPPVDFDPTPEAKQAIRELLADFPVDFSVFGVALERRVLLNCMLEMRNSFWLIALRDKYKSGRKLAEHLQKTMEIVTTTGYDDAGEIKPMTPAEAMRQEHPNLGDDVLAAGWLLQTIYALAWAADQDRPVGPVYEQARERFNSLSKTTQGRENVALEVLFEADRLHGDDFEADPVTLVESAVGLLMDELGRIPIEEAKRYNATDIEGVIRELVGLKDPNADGRSESPMNDTGNGDQPSKELEIF